MDKISILKIKEALADQFARAFVLDDFNPHSYMFAWHTCFLRFMVIMIQQYLVTILCRRQVLLALKTNKSYLTGNLPWPVT
ncbi:hypothetical protein ACTJKN_22370 [Pedobacter sp. 22163]|uniref:hypothetical protein n=1 Tax=Pedobacter sp. 22163 TaxID=3453883 RepID=UPI003F84DBDD